LAGVAEGEPSLPHPATAVINRAVTRQDAATVVRRANREKRTTATLTTPGDVAP
jgi:hypothetical protein